MDTETTQKQSIKKTRENNMRYNEIMKRHNLIIMNAEQLLSALYEEFAINDWDLLLTPDEQVILDAYMDTGKDELNEMATVLYHYYEYAAECATT